MENLITNIFNSVISEYGILGIIILFFIYKDTKNMESDRKDREMNRKVLGEIQKSIASSNVEIAKIEVRTKNLEKEVFGNKRSEEK